MQALLAIDYEAVNTAEQKSIEDYAQIQRRLLFATMIVSLAVFTITAFVFNLFVARSLLVGAIAGVFYLRLLARSVANLNG
ncbi:MAG TPA: hypothetical protein PLI52_00795, partial [Prochlorococcaceae cyanobacterium AMR_MDS_5431]|nr:hypothetical protein [Prochlorococcaceae cyanobacterium AMR_MDS_5431]